MADTVYTGAGEVLPTDIKYVKWIGKTKGGQTIKIELPKAFCRSDPNWTFAEKDDTTAEIEFEGVYEDEKLANGDRTEPWLITIPSEVTEGAGEILLGIGAFYVGTSQSDAKRVALTRGGGSFVVEREYREINADGDPGAVEGRITQEAGRPKLKLVALQWLTKVNKLYSGIKTGTALMSERHSVADPKQSDSEPTAQK